MTEAVDLIEQQAAELAEARAERDRQKRRGDNHWETLRGIRDIARKSGDLDRIILWVNDAGSGYVEPAEETIASLTDRATTAESERDELLREKERLGAGWRPIETAPKDGTTFLAYQAEEGVDFFHWQDFGADSTAPKGWRDSFIHVYPEGSENGPKHWMPLPVPPAAEQEAV